MGLAEDLEENKIGVKRKKDKSKRQTIIKEILYCQRKKERKK